MNKEAAKKKVAELVERFRVAEQSGIAKKYTEADTKKNLIEPLFAALGWPIDTDEVRMEETISGDRVDYGFYIDGRIQFYLEAKAVKADLNDERFAHQAIKYSWNKGVAWAVLTDFEDVKIFNAQDVGASLASKRFKTIHWDEYIDRFDELWLLSRAAWQEKLLDAEAEKSGKKLETVSVTSKLYEDLNEARALLSKSFWTWNKELRTNPVLLDEGVQKVLDRIIFIRVAEDRGIEQPTLRPLVREWYANWYDRQKRDKHLYQSMEEKFRELDGIYNSNIFARHDSDNWVDEKNSLQDIAEKFYGKEGYYEYDFKVIPADVLGTVYEQYLGHKLSKAEKGESGLSVAKDARKRKEQGIYYTPRFIVDYIVENALGPVLAKCDSFADLEKIKVLDPACGSGSFLIKALELIYKKYEEFGRKGQFIKLKILSENLYGVDLDEQAVEIARLNLLIAALETRMKMPNLDNIRVGNSLISGTDEDLKKQFGKDWRDKKPFNWEKEFPEVFKQGGFDVIIGNPPYISAVRDSNSDSAVREFYRDKFSLHGAFDLYVAFLMKAIELSSKVGSYGWIVPNKLMIADYAKETLKLLRENGLNTIIDVSKLNVFGSVGVYPVIVMGNKTKKGFQEYEAESAEDLQRGNFKSAIKVSDKYKTLIDFGVKIGSGATGFQAKSLIKHLTENKEKGTIPFVVSGSIDPYQLNLNDVRYMGHNYKNAYIKKGDDIAESKWKFWNGSKIVISGMTKRIEAHYFTPALALGVGVYAIFDYGKFDPYFLLAILNSRFVTSYIREKFKHKHLAGGYLAINKSTIEQVPIVKPDTKGEKQLAALARKRATLTDEFSKSTKDSEKWKKLKTEIERTDKEIDAEVYKLYGLTDDEIKIVEAN